MPEWLMKYQYEKITDNSIVRFSSHFRGLTTIMWLPPQFLSLTPLPRKNWHSTSMCLDSFMNINGCFLLWRAKGETLMSAIDSQLPSSSGQDRPTDEVDRILSPESWSYSVCNTSLSCTQVQSLFLLWLVTDSAYQKKLLRCSLARISFAAGSSHYCNVSVSAALWGSACRWLCRWPSPL